VPDVSEPSNEQAAAFWNQQENAEPATATSQHVDESLLAAKSGSGAASFWAQQEKAALEPAMAELTVQDDQYQQEHYEEPAAAEEYQE
jgi:hypothetical protein